jgi:hypothetical protein
MPAAVDVRVVAAEGDLVVGLNSNQWFGAVWRLERAFTVVPGGGGLVLSATDGRWIGGSSVRSKATIWDLDPMRQIDLQPTGFENWFGEVKDMQGGFQVGSVYEVVGGQAVLWRGTKESAHILTPPGYADSYATTIDGGDIYGEVIVRDSRHQINFPCVWRDLGARFEAYGFLGGYERVIQSRRGVQVGFRNDRRNQWQPFLWRGWPLGAVDLTPPGVYCGEALSTNGEVQVGYVIRRPPFPPVPTEGIAKAALWKGTRASYVDLHRLLPPFFDSSQATAVTADGTVYGYAANLPRSRPVPVVWRKVK